MTKANHILYATELNLSTHGGDITHVRHVLTALGKRGHDITLVTPKVRKPAAMPVRLVQLPGIPFRFLHLMSYELLLFLYACLTHAGARYRLVYVRSELYSLGASLYARLFRKPLILEINGFKTDEMRRRGISHRAIRVVEWVEKINCRRADLVVVTAPQLKRIYAMKYSLDDDKVIYLPNAADHRLFRPLDDSADEPAPRPRRMEDICVVGFSGRLVAWQGLANLIEAVRACRQRQDIRFRIVGDGPEMTWLKETIAQYNLTNRIELIGSVPHDEMAQWINGFDICLIPRDEGVVGMPVKLFEYMACGRPVVASRLEGFEFVETAACGILYDPGKIEQLAGAIIRLADDKNLRVQMGQRGRDLVERQFNWDAVAVSLEKLMQTVIGIQP